MDKKLLQKYVEGSITAEEVETVVDWLDADEKHVKEFMTLHKLYDISILNQSTQGQKERKSSSHRLSPYRNRIAKSCSHRTDFVQRKFLVAKR